MLGERSRLRPAALTAAGALSLHELRYLIGSDHGGQALADEGHAYLPAAGVLVALLLALAGAALAAAFARAHEGRGGGRRSAPFLAVWALASAALLGVYAAQELTEGLLVSGHPGGLDALVAGGGLVAPPLALGLGFLVALALRGADAAVQVIARRSRAVPPPRRLASRSRPFAAAVARPSSVLARKLAGRAPPVPS